MWLKILSSALTLAACALYLALYALLSDYQQSVVGANIEPPVFTRVILNIYQSYLSVFILISLALLVLFYIKSRRANGNYKIVFILIAFNMIFALVLFLVSYTGMA